MTNKPCFVVGLDLGRQSDPSAVAVARQTWKPGPKGLLTHYHFGHLLRYKLGTPYPDIVDDVAALVQKPPLDWPCLAIDATGVGRAVVDLFKRANPKAVIRAITITGGSAVSEVSPGEWRVAKKELVSVVQALLQPGRLTVAKSPLRQTLVKEMQNFKVKITESANETFEAWRAADHDDLVLAVALACWAGERGGFSGDIEINPDAYGPTANPPPGVFRDQPSSSRKDRDGNRLDAQGGIADTHW